MSAQPKTFLTPEQYLEIERKAEFKSEYFDGEMFAMAGASLAHNTLVAQLIVELGQQFRKKPCVVLPSDMRVRVSARKYTYPDVVAVCGKREFADNEADTLLNPTLLIEVLSPSTEACDRGVKFEQYQAIGSLREYLLVASDRAHADLYTRIEGGRWILSSADGLDSSIHLESVDAELTMANLYEKLVEFGDILTPAL